MRTSLFAVVAEGDLRIHFFAGGGADFAQPGTFSDGTRIASFSARYRTVLTVIAPNQAITTISGELVHARRSRSPPAAGRSGSAAAVSASA